MTIKDFSVCLAEMGWWSQAKFDDLKTINSFELIDKRTWKSPIQFVMSSFVIELIVVQYWVAWMNKKKNKNIETHFGWKSPVWSGSSMFLAVSTKVIGFYRDGEIII